MSYITATQFTQLKDMSLLGLIPMNTDNMNPYVISHPSMIIEQYPQLFLKRYFVGCLEKDKEQTLLIRRAGGIGDIIWTLATARALKNEYPLLKIQYCVLKKDMKWVSEVSFVDKVIESDFIKVKDLEGVDYVLDYFYSVEGYPLASVLDPYEISYKWAFGVLPEKLDTSNILSVSEAEELHAKSLVGKNSVALCLQSSSPKRSYPYVETLVSKLVTEGYSVVLLGDRRYELDGCVNMTGKTTFNELKALIKACDKVISVDSGNLHIAGGFRKPSVGLFTSVKADTRVKYYPSIKAIQSPIWCNGCLQLGEFCPRDGECMSQIGVKKIVDTLKEL